MPDLFELAPDSLSLQVGVGKPTSITNTALRYKTSGTAHNSPPLLGYTSL